MGMIYAWASPEYLLNKMSLEEIFFYFDWGTSLLTGKPAGVNKDKPNRKEFYKYYGDKIKRPEVR